MAFRGAKFFLGLKIFISVCLTITADIVLELSETQLLRLHDLLLVHTDECIHNLNFLLAYILKCIRQDWQTVLTLVRWSWPLLHGTTVTVAYFAGLSNATSGLEWTSIRLLSVCVCLCSYGSSCDSSYWHVTFGLNRCSTASRHFHRITAGHWLQKLCVPLWTWDC